MQFIKLAAAGILAGLMTLGSAGLSAATLPKDANTTCPVMTKEDADPEMTVQYKGKNVYLCCAKCKRKFMQDPDKYMKRIDDDAKAKKAAAEKAKSSGK